ncbi:MAG: hypothetical protein QOG67_3022 [Verrucomicrobiota bacterium]|jgi:predicted lipoprotein
MTASSLLRSFRRAAFLVCLALALAPLAPSARADDLPKFSAPEVNDFVKKYSDFVDQFVKASAAKDEAKMKELSASMDSWASTTGPAIETKIKPEEKEAFDKWMGALFEKLLAASTPPK